MSICRHNRGNAYLQEYFPRLDYILSCHVISNDYTIKTESLIDTEAVAADIPVTDPYAASLQVAVESGSDKDVLPSVKVDVTSEVGEGSNPDALSGVDSAVSQDVDSPRDLKAESSSGLIDEKKLQFMRNEHQRRKEPEITIPVPKGHNSDLLNLIEEKTKTNNVKTINKVPTQQYLRNIHDKYELLLDHPNSVSFMLSPPFILLATGLMCVGVCVVYILRVRKQSVARHKSY